mgnify:CR=1 FL=1
MWFCSEQCIPNKLFKRDKLQLAGSASLHILANYNLPLNRALGLLFIMFSPSKLSAFLSGIPIGSAMIWLNSRNTDGNSSFLISDGQASLILVVYFLLSMFLFTLGFDSITKRIKYPISKLYSEPKVFINYHSSLMASDIFKMLIDFFGAMVGGVIIGTQT